MILSSQDNVGLTKPAGGSGTRGDVAMQIDDGTTPNPAPFWYDKVDTMRTLWYVRDVASAAAPFTTSSSVGGVSLLGEPLYPNMYQMRTNAGTTARAGRDYNPLFNFDTTSHLFRYDAKVREGVLSNGTDTFNLTFGFTDGTVTIDAVDGAYYKVDSNTSADFQCTTSSNSTRTVTDSGLAIVATTWYRGIVDVTNVTNAAFRIYADGGSYPTTATITTTTNIPTGPTRSTQILASILKSAGTTSVGADIAYQQLSHDRLAA